MSNLYAVWLAGGQSEAALEIFTKNNLSDELRSRNLKVSGSKAELVTRLHDYFTNSPSPLDQAGPSTLHVNTLHVGTIRSATASHAATGLAATSSKKSSQENAAPFGAFSNSESGWSYSFTTIGATDRGFNYESELTGSGTGSRKRKVGAGSAAAAGSQPSPVQWERPFDNSVVPFASVPTPKTNVVEENDSGRKEDKEEGAKELDDLIVEAEAAVSEMAENDADWTFCAEIDALPLITTEDGWTLKYPCDEEVCRQVVERCETAPVGIGGETVIDQNLRRGLQLSASKIKILSTDWLNMFDSSLTSPFLERVRLNLAPQCSVISAKFYKMLLYEPGSFFKAHKDTQREANHFGSLVVFMPCNYTGGDLIIRHGNKSRSFSFSLARDDLKTSSLKSYAVAFFTDCEHEILPIESGHRITLTYNLYFTKLKSNAAPPIPPQLDSEFDDAITEIFLHSDWPKGGKLGIILHHDYAMVAIEPQLLKGADKLLFDALVASGKFKVELVAVGIRIEGQGSDEDASARGIFQECLENGYPMNMSIFQLNQTGERKLLARYIDFESNQPGVEELEGSVMFLTDLNKLAERKFVAQDKHILGNEGVEFELRYALAALLISHVTA